MPPTTAPRRRVKFKQRTPRSTRANGRRTQRVLVAALLAIGFGAPAALFLRAVVREGLSDPARIARRFQVGAPVNDEPLLRLPAAPSVPAAPVAATSAPAGRGSAAGWNAPAPAAPVSRSWESPFANGGRTTVINPAAPVAFAPAVRLAAPNAGLAAGFAPSSFAAASAARGVTAPAVSVGVRAVAAPALSGLVASAAAPAAVNLAAVESAPAARPGLTTGAASLSPGPHSHAVLPAANITLGSFTWSGAAVASGSPASPNWNVGNNWVGNAAPSTNANADIVYTPTPAGATATNVEQVYRINSLTFQGPVALLGPDTPSYNVTQNSFAYLSVGAGGIQDASANAQTLSTQVYADVADNTINVSNAAGRLNMPGAVANPSASPAVPIALYLQGANRVVTVDGPGTTNITGVVTQGGPATSGALVKNGVGTLILAGNNDYSGGTTLNAGTIELDNNTALGTGTFTVNNSVTVTNNAVASGTPFPVAVTIANAVALNGNLAHGTSNADLTFSGAVTLAAGNHTISSTNANFGNLTFSGAISGVAADSGLTFTNSARDSFFLTGNAANTYAGATVVDGATLFLRKGGAVAIPGDLTVQGTAVGTTGYVVTDGGQLAAKTNLTVNNGGVFDATGGFGFSANETVASLNGNGGFVTLGNQFIATTLTVGQGNYAGIIQDGFIYSDRPALASRSSLNGAPITFSPEAFGALVKNSAGTLTLTNNNTYSSGTLVSAGAVFANNAAGSSTPPPGGNSATGSGDVFVLDGARLGGNGSVGRSPIQSEGIIPGSNVVIGGSLVVLNPEANRSGGAAVNLVANPAILGAGATGLNSTAILTINGNLTLTDTALLETELGGTTAGTGYDQIRVGGAIALGGDLSLALINGFALTVGQTFYILDGLGTDPVDGVFANVTPGAANLGTFTDPAGNVFRVNYADSDPNDPNATAGNDVSVTVLAVPEPGTWMILGLGALAGIGAAVRRRRQPAA